MRSAINTSLMLLVFLTVFFSSVSFADGCPIGISSGQQEWNGAIYGTSPYLCLGTAGNCKYRATVNLCLSDTGECYGEFISTGDTCTESEGQSGDMMWPGGDFVDVPEPEQPEKLTTECVNNYYNNQTGAMRITCEYDFDTPLLNKKINNVTGKVENINKYLTTQIPSFRSVLDQQSYLLQEYSSLSLSKLDALTNSQETIVDGISSLTTLAETGQVTTKDTNNQIKSLVGMSNYYFPYLNTQISAQTNNVTTSIQSRLDSISNQMITHRNGVVSEITASYSPIRVDIAANKTAIDALSSQMTAIQNAIENMEGGSGGDNTAVMSALDALSGDVSGLASDIGTLSGSVEGLSTQIGEGFDGMTTELQGIGDGIDSIVGVLNGDGLTVGTPTGQINFAENGLYGAEAITDLQAEIEALQTEYSDQMAAMKNLFSFDSGELNSGQYVEHRWEFHIRGNSYSFGSSVFPALLDNSSLIAAVLLFLAVLFGVRFLVK